MLVIQDLTRTPPIRRVSSKKLCALMDAVTVKWQLDQDYGVPDSEKRTASLGGHSHWMNQRDGIPNGETVDANAEPVSFRASCS